MKIYGHPMSTCTRKVLTALEEKGASYEFVLVDLSKGEQKQAAHMARHPFGVVPALEDNGFTMFESRAMAAYVDERFPGTPLTPADITSRALMHQWINVEQSYFTPHAMKIISQNIFVPMRGGTPDAAAVDAGRAELTKTLDVLEKHLAKSTYFVGSAFSLADINYMPYVEYLFAAKAGDLVTSHPAFAAWWTRVSERPSWQKIARR